MTADSCPACGAWRSVGARFCEKCGHRWAVGPSTTGPDRQSAPVWLAEVSIDPFWYAEQLIDDPLPARQDRRVVELDQPRALVGRRSSADPGQPLIDCEPDPGVSRRHAWLSFDGNYWWVADLGSANGTFVGTVDQPIPSEPIEGSSRRLLQPSDVLYCGAWTRISLRSG